MLFEHVDCKNKVVRRPRHSVAPLHARANIHHDFGVVCIESVSGGNPRQRLGVDLVAIEEVERLVEKLIADPRDATRYEGVEGVVVLDLAAAGVVLGAIDDQRAVARYLLQTVRGLFVATGYQGYTAEKGQAPSARRPDCPRPFFHIHPTFLRARLVTRNGR